jgi:hypothetical protein
MLYTVNFLLTDCETAIHCTQLAERMRRVVKDGGQESIKNARLTLYETFEDLRVHIIARDFVHDHGGHWEAFFERNPGLKTPIAAFVKAVDGFDKAIVACDPATMKIETEWPETTKLREVSEVLRAALGGEPSATDWLTGNLSDLSEALGLKARRGQAYFAEEAKKGSIEFREIPARGTIKYQMRHTIPGEHQLAKERLAKRLARKELERGR